MAYINHNVPTMSMPSGMNRMDQFPLDMSSVYYSYDVMETYAKTSAISYVGQILSLINYAEDGTTVTGVTVYSIQNEAGDLQKVGSVDADNISLKKNDAGLLELAGFKAAATATLPQKKIAEDGTVTLEWVTVDAIVEGDGNTTYTVAAVKKGEEVVGFTFTPSEGEAVTITLDVYTKSEVDALIGNYTTPESAEGAGDGVAASGLRAEIELKANAADVYTKTEADDKIAEEIGKKIHMTTEVVETLPDAADAQANVIYLVPDADNAESGAYIEYVLVEKDGAKSLEPIGTTVTDLSNYYTKTEIDGKTETIENRIKTLEDVDNATQDELDAYKATVENTYAKAADVYTKDETDTAISNAIGTPGVPAVKDEEGNITTEATPGTGVYQHTYSKSEVTQLIADITGGESAADVLAALNEYKTTTNESIRLINEKNGTQDTAIETAQNKANKAEGDAATAQTKANDAYTQAQANLNEINTLKDTTVPGVKAVADKNKEDIAALQTTVSGHTGTIAGLETAVASKAETSTVEALAARVGTNEGSVATLTSDLAALTTTVGGKANTSEVYTKTEIGAIAEGKTIVDMINDAKTAATYDDTQVKADIAANAAAIAAEAARADAAEKANATEIAKLDAALKLAVEDTSEGSGINSIKELATWVNTHGEEAAAMTTAINANKDAIAVLNGGAEVAGSVANLIAEAAPGIANITVAGLVKSVANTVENGVNVAEDGTMSVNSLNVNRLVQTSGETLVLNGGNASGEIEA